MVSEHLLMKDFSPVFSREEIQDLDILVHPTLNCVSAGDKIEENEMGWACGAYG